VRIHNVHERTLAAPPEAVAEWVAGEALWPDPGPKPVEDGLRVGVMLWRPVERADAALAFRIVEPAELRAEHWFEVVAGEGGTTLRHTVDGEAVGPGEELWRDRIEPLHDWYVEQLLDRAQEAVA
jgi:hypothetical protein